MHTHASVQATTIPYMYWRGTVEDTVVLSALPMFHVTGMQACMNAPLHTAATLVLLSRWDRECAALQIERAGVTNWSAITTMLVDFLSNPQLERYDLSSLRVLGGGGAAMPEAVARRLEEVIGLPYVEGYGLSETMAPTHINPPHRPKRQCGGIPIFNTDAPGVPRARRQALFPHRRPRLLRRRGLLLHYRPPQAHDQRFGLQGLAGGGRGHALCAPRDPGGLRHRRAGRLPRRNREGADRAQARRDGRAARRGHHRVGARPHGGVQGAARGGIRGGAAQDRHGKDPVARAT